MSTHVKEIAVVDRVREMAARLGFWTSLVTAAVTLIAFAIGILTPPRSGPFCIASCVAYPYTSTAAFFPRDYLWMVPAILLTPLFMLLCVCVDFWVQIEQKMFSRIALMLATIGAAIITLDYFIQIEVIQPSLIKGETDGIALFSQYNPHGVFIAMEDLGYLAMSAAFFFVGVALVGRNRLESAMRWLLVVGAALGFLTFIGLSLVFRNSLETRFEIAIITINWTILTVAAVMLCALFRRTLRQTAI